MAEDLYKVLGIKRKASKDDIRTAFKKLAKETHTDAGGDGEAFILVKRAHDVLMDDKARAEYDNYGFLPGDKDSELTAQALKELKGLFIKIVQTNSIENIVQTDIIERMRAVVRENLSKVDEQVSALEQNLLEPERLKAELTKRLRCKAKLAPEVMLAAIDEMIAPMAAQKNMLDAARCMMDRCLELLEDYSFTHDAPPPRPMMFQMRPFGSVGSATTFGGW